MSTRSASTASRAGVTAYRLRWSSRSPSTGSVTTRAPAELDGGGRVAPPGAGDGHGTGTSRCHDSVTYDVSQPIAAVEPVRAGRRVGVHLEADAVAAPGGGVRDHRAQQPLGHAPAAGQLDDADVGDVRPDPDSVPTSAPPAAAPSTSASHQWSQRWPGSSRSRNRNSSKVSGLELKWSVNAASSTSWTARRSASTGLPGRPRTRPAGPRRRRAPSGPGRRHQPGLVGGHRPAHLPPGADPREPGRGQPARAAARRRRRRRCRSAARSSPRAAPTSRPGRPPTRPAGPSRPGRPARSGRARRRGRTASGRRPGRARSPRPGSGRSRRGRRRSGGSAARGRTPRRARPPCRPRPTRAPPARGRAAAR